VKNLAPLPDLPERYTAKGLLGEGATGSVYRATDHVLGVDVALKIVRPNLAMYARFRARFAREVTLSAQVVHPRLVPVHDTGRLEDGRPFVALAFADAGSMSSLMTRPLSLTEGVRLVDQVLDALAALHARGVLHQDLKPANVLLHTSLPDQVDAWVADLGVAAALSELAMNKRSISGTPTWMAPEQLTAAHHELGPWTDLYAVGLILHALLSGPPSVDLANRKKMLDLRLERAPDLPEDAPPAVAEVVRNLLDPDPRQRYDRAADVRRALRDATADLVDRPLTGDLSVLGDTTDTVGPGNTSFSQSILPEAQAAVVTPRRPTALGGDAPRWNRVAPDRMPLRPPPARGVDSASTTSLGLFALRDPPMVAREPLRRLLWQKARETILSGGQQVVLVIGETGSGKSRVVESVVHGLDEGGFMESLSLRYHHPGGVDDGYRGAVREILAPWNDTRPALEARLQRWLARDQQVSPRAVANEAQVLARWCGYRQPQEEPVNAAVGLAYLYRYLDAHAWRGGACLVLEDVQHAAAEGDGLAICDALVSESVGRRPVVIFATLTSEAIDQDPALATRVRSLIARGALQVNCSRLSAAQMGQLLIMSLNLAPRLAAEIAPVCEGSPSYAMLLMRDWAGRGMLIRNVDMHFDLRDDVNLDSVLPRDLPTLCHRRITGALSRCEDPHAASAALAATALAGQVPPVSVVQSLYPEGLDGLLATGLVQQQGWRLVFEHPAVRNLTLQLASQRDDLRVIHRGLADAWEALGKRTGVEVNLPLGEHRLHAGMPKAAAGPLVEAARSALVEGRFSLSLNSARLAVEAADQVAALPSRVLARRQVAEALIELDRGTEARQVLDEIASLGHIDRNTTAHLRVLAARVAMEADDLVQARRLLDNAKMTFEATRDRVGQVESAHCLGVLARIQGRPDLAADQYAHMLRTNRNDLRREAIALFGLVESSIAAGRIPGVDRTVERLRRVARESGDTRNIAQATFAGGLLHLRRRNLTEAERHFLTARALAATLGGDNLLLACLRNLAEINRYRGDDDAAEGLLRTAARLATERGWHLHAASSRVQLGVLALVRGADRLAHIEIARAERLLQAHPQHHCWLSIAVVRALWAAEADLQHDCRDWWQRAQQHGLGRQRSPDLWVPLERMAAVTERRGWTDLATSALAAAHGQTTAVHRDGRPGTHAEVEVEVDDVEGDEFVLDQPIVHDEVIATHWPGRVDDVSDLFLPELDTDAIRPVELTADDSSVIEAAEADHEPTGAVHLDYGDGDPDLVGLAEPDDMHSQVTVLGEMPVTRGAPPRHHPVSDDVLPDDDTALALEPVDKPPRRR